MKYEQWRNELFDLPPDSDPVSHEYSEEFYAVSSNDAFDYVDKMLVDLDVHVLFSKDQLGKGINTIYSNCCSDLPFLYTTECDEDRRIIGIENLVYLYRNYFDRHCTGEVTYIGNDQNDGPLGYICYMLWDVFVLYPGNASPAMISAAINVMPGAMPISRSRMGMRALSRPPKLPATLDPVEQAVLPYETTAAESQFMKI